MVVLKKMFYKAQQVVGEMIASKIKQAKEEAIKGFFYFKDQTKPHVGNPYKIGSDDNKINIIGTNFTPKPKTMGLINELLTEKSHFTGFFAYK